MKADVTTYFRLMQQRNTEKNNLKHITEHRLLLVT